MPTRRHRRVEVGAASCSVRQAAGELASVHGEVAAAAAAASRLFAAAPRLAGQRAIAVAAAARRAVSSSRDDPAPAPGAHRPRPGELLDAPGQRLEVGGHRRGPERSAFADLAPPRPSPPPRSPLGVRRPVRCRLTSAGRSLVEQRAHPAVRAGRGAADRLDIAWLRRRSSPDTAVAAAARLAASCARPRYPRGSCPDDRRQSAASRDACCRPRSPP